MESLSKGDVAKVANLARLALSEDEQETLTGQLNALLLYFKQLEELDTDGVEPTSHIVPLNCPQRPDEVHGSLPREQVMSQAPQRQEEYFLVPAIIE